MLPVQVAVLQLTAREAPVTAGMVSSAQADGRWEAAASFVV